MVTVNIGDYIEGFEKIGTSANEELGIEDTSHVHKIRLIVNNMWKCNEHTIYTGQADDNYKGDREGCIDSSLGEVRIIKDEQPFTRKWWDNNTKEEQKVIDREWKALDIVRHFKGDLYKIIDIGIDTETEKEVVIYKREDNTGNVWVRPLDMFNSKVDKEKYPNCEQEYRFELVERVGE